MATVDRKKLSLRNQMTAAERLMKQHKGMTRAEAMREIGKAQVRRQKLQKERRQGKRPPRKTSY